MTDQERIYNLIRAAERFTLSHNDIQEATSLPPQQIDHAIVGLLKDRLIIRDGSTYSVPVVVVYEPPPRIVRAKKPADREKRCCRCERMLTAKDFYPRAAWCKPCWRTYVRERRRLKRAKSAEATYSI